MSNNELNSLLGSEHYTSLTCELKCPCGDYLRPPIKLCTKGHSVCKRCWRRQQRCPTCQEAFTETRSVALEALVDKLQFPCPHNSCTILSPLKDLDDHAAVCNMRPTSCFMAQVYEEDCDWKGLAATWLDHCLSEHTERVTDLPFVTFSGSWAPKTKSPIIRYHLLRCYEKVFNVYQIYDTKSGKMMWSVVMTGNKIDDSTSYYFDLEIHNPAEFTRRISFRQSCKNGNDLDILESSQNVLVPLEQILYMLDQDKNLHFHLRISEVSPNSPVERIPEEEEEIVILDGLPTPELDNFQNLHM